MELTDEQWEQARRIARAKAGDLVRGDAARQEDLAQEALERLLRMEDRAFDDLDAFVRQIVNDLIDQWGSDTDIEFVSRFAVPLPVKANRICILLESCEPLKFTL